MKFISAILVSSLLFVVGGFAEEEAGVTAGADRIAWIDLPRVLQGYQRAEEMVADFEKEKAAHEAEVEKVIAEIERLEGEMLLLSASAKASRQETILKKKISVNTMIEKAERELSRKSMIHQAKLVEEVSAAAEIVARREGYAYVIRKEVLLYQNLDREITDRVIAELEKE